MYLQSVKKYIGYSMFIYKKNPQAWMGKRSINCFSRCHVLCDNILSELGLIPDQKDAPLLTQ